MPPTLAQVAKRAGVAVSTASAILRDEPTCFASAPTRRRVVRAAEALRYRRNALAAGLRTRRTRSIGVVLRAVAGGPSVYVEKLDALETLAWEADYRLLFATHQHDLDRAYFHLEELAAQYVAGLILTPPPVPAARLAEFAQWIEHAPMPVVTMESHLDLAACDVSVDREAGAYLQVTHLLELGRRRLAFVIPGTDAPPVQRRIDGYKRALAEAGMRLEDQLVIARPNEANLHAAMQLVNQALEAGHRFDGLVAMSDLVAAGAMRALVDSGLRIPDDVAVVGFDDDVFAPGLVMPLTTIRQPRHAGRLAFEQLLRRMERQQDAPAQPRAERIVLSPELVVRDSTCGNQVH